MGSSASKRNGEESGGVNPNYLWTDMGSDKEVLVVRETMPTANYLWTGMGFNKKVVAAREGSTQLAGVVNQAVDYYSVFKFHKFVAARKERATLVISTGTSVRCNQQAEDLATTICQLCGDPVNLAILYKGLHLNKELIRLYLSKVQEKMSEECEKIKEEAEELGKLYKDDDDDDDSDGSWDPEQTRRERYQELKELKHGDGCVACQSTLVIATEERVFVAGPGLVVVAILSPSIAARVLSVPSDDPEVHSELQVSEFKGGLKQDEFLVMFWKTSAELVSRVENLQVSGTEDVVTMCRKLNSLDTSGKGAFYVLHGKEAFG